MTAKPLIGIVADIRHFDGYDWHATPQTYLRALIEVADVTPLIIPAFGDSLDFDAILSSLDGILLSGSKSNVHPANYGVAPHTNHEPFDEGRDATSLPLARKAIEAGIPLLAICRGIQELNVALGGTLATEIQLSDDIMDHRAATSLDPNVRFAIHQDVDVKENSCLAKIVGEKPFKINSLHRQAIDRLAPSLEVEAHAKDGVIEAVHVRDAKAFAMGVQWHPEFWAQSDAPSKAIFEAFGDAARTYCRAKA